MEQNTTVPKHAVGSPLPFPMVGDNFEVVTFFPVRPQLVYSSCITDDPEESLLAQVHERFLESEQASLEDDMLEAISPLMLLDRGLHRCQHRFEIP